MYSTTLFLLAVSLSQAVSYHILCVFPLPSKSHTNLAKGIVDALLDAGHQVTWGTPFLQKTSNNNLRQIDLSATLQTVAEMDMTDERYKNTPPSFVKEFSRNITTVAMQNKELLDAIVKIQYDAVVTEWFFSDADAGFAAVQRVPWILLSGVTMHSHLEMLVDEVRSIPTHPLIFNDFPVPMSLYERLVNSFIYGMMTVSNWFAAVQRVPWILLSGVTMHSHLEMLVDEVRSIPTHPLIFNDFPVPMSLYERLVNSFIYGMMTVSNWFDDYSNEAFYQAQFGPLAKARGFSLPPYSEAVHNVSILLVNSDPAIDKPRSVPPNVISVAGYHIKGNPAPLPKDLQTILDSSSKGFVYFSMGSVVKSSAFPEKLIRGLSKLLGELPYTVLWKFEKELTNVPKNVHVRPWFPQASVLAHPNIKVFITHGGLLSLLEATNAGVPLLAVPVFGDQPSNAARLVRAGVARKVPFSSDMLDDLKRELNEMLGNDKYQKKAKEVSKLFHNRPVAPSKLVSHYIEVAIESKGAYHLRSPAKLYTWYQRWMLDQLAILAVIVFLAIKLWKTVLSFVKSKLFGSKKQKRS